MNSRFPRGIVAARRRRLLGRNQMPAGKQQRRDQPARRLEAAELHLQVIRAGNLSDGRFSDFERFRCDHRNLVKAGSQVIHSRSMEPRKLTWMIGGGVSVAVRIRSEQAMMIRATDRRSSGFDASLLRVAGWFLCLLAVVAHPGCDTAPRPDRARYLPAPAVAREAVEKALGAWQDSAQIERTTTTIRPIMFVEQQQPAGQRLLGFEILGETPGYQDEGYRRYMVRLNLADPDDSVVAVYHVFGEGPVWVYRAEDFEMIMHMDKSMMPAPPTPADAGEPGEQPSPEHRPDATR